MQYDRVHEYLEARCHTRESYVEAFCDKVRVVKMGCTYKEWCLSEDVRASEWGAYTDAGVGLEEGSVTACTRRDGTRAQAWEDVLPNRGLL